MVWVCWAMEINSTTGDMNCPYTMQKAVSAPTVMRPSMTMVLPTMSSSTPNMDETAFGMAVRICWICVIRCLLRLALT